MFDTGVSTGTRTAGDAGAEERADRTVGAGCGAWSAWGEALWGEAAWGSGVSDVVVAGLSVAAARCRVAENVARARSVETVCEMAEIRFADADRGGGDPFEVLREVVAEVAAALRVTQMVARPLVETGLGLDRLPLTAVRLVWGSLDWARVVVIESVLGKASDATIRALEFEAVAAAERLGARSLRLLLWRMWMEFDPAEASAAKEVSVKGERGVSVRQDGGGVSQMKVTLTDVEGAEAEALIEEMVGSVCSQDPRSAKEMRVDALLGLLHGEHALECRCDRGEECPQFGLVDAPDSRRGALIQILIDVQTLLGLSQNPAVLADGTALDAEAARIVAQDATWQALLVELAGSDVAQAAKAAAQTQQAAQSEQAAQTQPGASPSPAPQEPAGSGSTDGPVSGTAGSDSGGSGTDTATSASNCADVAADLEDGGDGSGDAGSGDAGSGGDGSGGDGSGDGDPGDDGSGGDGPGGEGSGDDGPGDDGPGGEGSGDDGSGGEGSGDGDTGGDGSGGDGSGGEGPDDGGTGSDETGSGRASFGGTGLRLWRLVFKGRTRPAGAVPNVRTRRNSDSHDHHGSPRTPHYRGGIFGRGGGTETGAAAGTISGAGTISAASEAYARAQLIAALTAAIDADPTLADGIYPDGHGGHREPPTGALTYRPASDVAALVRMTYSTCTHPGCERPSTRCELDHIVPFDHRSPHRGGWTIDTNLHPVCKSHHQLKTRKAWTTVMLAGSAILWTSPAGIREIALPRLGLPTPPRSRKRRRKTATPDTTAIDSPTWWETNMPADAAPPTRADLDAAESDSARAKMRNIRRKFREHNRIRGLRKKSEPPPF